MIWPWVSRRAYDDACAQRDEARAEAKARGDALETLTREVYRDMLQMRRDGFDPLPAAIAFQPPRDTLPEPVRRAVNQRGVTQSLKAELTAWAKGQLSGGANTDDVARQILHGIAGGDE